MTTETPQQETPKKRRLSPAVIGVIVVVAVIVGGVLMYLFQPWKLFVDDVVDEAAPVAASTASPLPSEDATAEASPATTTGPEPAATEPPALVYPVELARGDFISHEHTTTGSASILELEDGSRILRIEDLNTSNGPDLKVWLTDAPVIEGRDGWFVFDDGNYVDLGRLKGNIGSQNYNIPDDVDIDDFSSISIWCQRFSVSFGAAELKTAA